MQENIFIPKYPPAVVARIINRIRVVLIRFTRKLAPANVVVFEMLQQFWLSKAIGVAAELGIADILKSSPQKINELAMKTECDRNALYRLLRVLASNGIFRERNDGFFEMTRLAEPLCSGGNTMKNMVIHHQNPAHWAMFGELMETVKTGKSLSDKVLGMEPFEFLAQNPERNATFNKAMTDSAALLSAAVLSAYDFSGYKIIADIGGGQGYLLASVLYKNKALRGILFDQEHVVNEADKNLDYFNVKDRTEISTGNFFENVPAGAEAYILKSVLHDWEDGDCREILSVIRKNMPDNAKILIIEAVIERNNQPSLAKMLDLLMLAVKKGGKERTLEQFDGLLRSEGLRINHVYKTVSPFSVIEAVKTNPL